MQEDARNTEQQALKHPPLQPEQDPGNRVLASDAQRPGNFFRSDRILRSELARRCSPAGLAWMAPRLDRLGVELATRMDGLSLDAERNAPRLEQRDLYGQRQDRIVFHPAYQELKRIAVDSGMFRVKWAPELRARFAGESHRLGFAAGALYAMGEAGLYCPLCMTDGVARILDRHAAPEDRDRLLARIATKDGDALATGAMFLTEKAGGSDVGANRCIAVPVGKEEPDSGARPIDAPLPGAEAVAPGAWNRLYGEKWFCSNASAEIVLALARSQAGLPGTRGLGIYLIEAQLPDGRPNPRRYLRLKEKLGVRSMASAEIDLDGVLGKRLGADDQGFAIMTEMINLSRLYNAVTAVALARRAIVEAWMHLKQRVVFGKRAAEHALVRERLATLGSRWLGEHYLLWHTIQALDEADAKAPGNGAAQRQSAALLRLFTPMLKRSSAEFAVYATRECMELMGGLGYIEQGIMPKLHRDALVLPIWEGAGNIMLLDMLRALRKSEAAEAVLHRFGGHPADRQALKRAFSPLAKTKAAVDAGSEAPEALEWISRSALEALTRAVQRALIREAAEGHHGASRPDQASRPSEDGASGPRLDGQRDGQRDGLKDGPMDGHTDRPKDGVRGQEHQHAPWALQAAAWYDAQDAQTQDVFAEQAQDGGRNNATEAKTRAHYRPDLDALDQLLGWEVP